VISRTSRVPREKETEVKSKISHLEIILVFFRVAAGGVKRGGDGFQQTTKSTLPRGKTYRGQAGLKFET